MISSAQSRPFSTHPGNRGPKLKHGRASNARRPGAGELTAKADHSACLLHFPWSTGECTMTYGIRRREFMAGIAAGLIASPAVVRAQGQPVVIRAGALKLIHSIAPYFYDQFVPAGYKIEVMPFETPDRMQERRRNQVGRFRRVRHCRRTPRRRRRRAGRGHRLDLQQRHGHHRQKGLPGLPRSRI